MHEGGKGPLPWLGRPAHGAHMRVLRQLPSDRHKPHGGGVLLEEITSQGRLIREGGGGILESTRVGMASRAGHDPPHTHATQWELGGFPALGGSQRRQTTTCCPRGGST